jgi:uncharacterized protein YcnI
MKKYVLIAASALGALILVGASAAHVEPAVDKAAAGGSTIIPFVVPHGCDGSPTRSISIQIAAGVTSAKPQAKQGWKLTIVRGKLPQPVKDFAGNTLTRGVLSVTWSGGTLPDSQFDTFNILLGMPNTPGKTVYFPVVQRCAKGVTRWIQIPKSGQAEPEHPAPGVTLVKSSGDHD